jgi:hypothetical protein
MKPLAIYHRTTKGARFTIETQNDGRFALYYGAANYTGSFNSIQEARDFADRMEA